MTRFSALIIALLLATSGHSQSFLKHQTEISAGVGIRFIYDDGAYYRSRYTIPPILLSAEHGISKHFSLGIYGQFYKSRIEKRHFSGYAFTEQTQYNTEYIGGVRALYHFRFITHCDIYTGVMVGTDGRGASARLVLAGMKYRLDNGFAAYADLNLPLSSTVGVSYRFLSGKGK
jgi:hypothetical protein